jgi:hypothetical protein
LILDENFLKKEVKLFGFLKKNTLQKSGSQSHVNQPAIIPPPKNRAGVIFDGFQQPELRINPAKHFVNLQYKQEIDVCDSGQKTSDLESKLFLSKNAPIPSITTNSVPTLSFAKTVNNFTTKSNNLTGLNKAVDASKVNLSSHEHTAESVERIHLPLSVVVRSLPEDILSISAEEAIAYAEKTCATVSMPFDEIFTKLPSGKIDVPLWMISEQIPPFFLKEKVGLNRTINLPLSDVVSRIPTGKLAKPVNVMSLFDYKSINSPFTPATGKLEEEKSHVQFVYRQHTNQAVIQQGSTAEHSDSNLHQINLTDPSVVDKSRPKPPVGTISDSALLSSKGMKTVFKNTLTDLQSTSPEQAQKDYEQHISFHNIPLSAQLPKLTPPPKHIIKPPLNTVPNISIAPTTKNKPTIIGGSSHFAQPISTTSREKLAFLAKSAAEQRGFSITGQKLISEEQTKIFAFKENLKEHTLIESVSQPVNKISYTEKSPENPTESAFVQKELNQTENHLGHSPFSTVINEKTKNFAKLAPTKLSKPTSELDPFLPTEKSQTFASRGFYEKDLRSLAVEASYKEEISKLGSDIASTEKSRETEKNNSEQRQGSLPDFIQANDDYGQKSKLGSQNQTLSVTKKMQEFVTVDTSVSPKRFSISESASSSKSAPVYQNSRLALARWLGLESDSPVPIESVPVLLTSSPYIKGAAVVDTEGLTLASRLPSEITENSIGDLTLRLYQLAKKAASEMGSIFEGQCVVTLGRWTIQITHSTPFFLVTFHDGLDFPPALSRRLRKVVTALVRQETLG